MPVFLALSLAVGVLTCVFALQNAAPVRVSFLAWQYEASMALVLLTTFALGAVAGLFAALPGLIKRSWQLRDANRRLRDAGAAGPGSAPRITVEKPTPERLRELGTDSWEVWEKEPSTFPWHYDERETCRLLEGEAVVEAPGQRVEFGAGDLVVFPAGLDCTWTVKKAIRKRFKFG